MLRFLVIIPLLLTAGWFIYLKTKGYSIRQGKQGFIYILIISATIAVFYTILLWLTQK